MRSCRHEGSDTLAKATASLSPSWQRTWQHTVAQTRQTHDNFSRTHHHPLRMKIHYSTYMRCDEPIAGTISPGWRTHSAQQPADDLGDCIQTTKPASSIQLTKLVSGAINETRAWVKPARTQSLQDLSYYNQHPYHSVREVQSTRLDLHYTMDRRNTHVSCRPAGETA